LQHLPDQAIEAQSTSMYRAEATCINLSVCDGAKFFFIPLRPRDAPAFGAHIEKNRKHGVNFV
jgi:hypothetical protein